jgi:hypothetical protein
MRLKQHKGFFYSVNTVMKHTELQELALKKYNTLAQARGGELRLQKLYNIQTLLTKQCLTDADVAQLKHFVNSSKEQLRNTAYVANTVISPTSWDHITTQIQRKS